MTTREVELEAKIKELEARLKKFEGNSLVQAVEEVGGEPRYAHDAASTHKTTVVETTAGGEKVIKTK